MIMLFVWLAAREAAYDQLFVPTALLVAPFITVITFVIDAPVKPAVPVNVISWLLVIIIPLLSGEETVIDGTCAAFIIIAADIPVLPFKSSAFAHK